MGVFYHVVEGDPLDSGNNSEVIEGLSGCTIEGPDGRSRNQAFIRHRAYCGVCKSAGLIAEGPGTPDYDLRMYDVTIRAHEAVEGDIVICECRPPPRIIAVYGRSSSIHDIGVTTSAAPLGAARVVNDVATHAYDRTFVITNNQTGKPLPAIRYRLTLDSGQVVEGETDAQGVTQRVSANEMQNVKIEVFV
jgi:hypothetical protein